MPPSRPERGSEIASSVAPLPLTHPALIAAAVTAAACILVSVSIRIHETDFWQHLLVGRAIFETGSVPTRHLWSWPTYGAPDVNSSWGFSLLIWPFWAVGEFWGLAVWRWLTTIAAFAVLWAVARRMGARGFTALLVLVVCALVYRQRVQVRPETLSGVLMALMIWVLERRRQASQTGASWRGAAPWLVAIAWVWANTHISYFLGFVWMGLYLLDDLTTPRHGARRGELALVMALAAAVSFLNPFGWRALWQPFEYFLSYRGEPIYQMITEQARPEWSHNIWNGLPVLIVLWPVLALWRWRRVGLDRVELLACAIFTSQALMAQRFIGPYALACAAFLARDLDHWVATRAWPAWTRPAGARAALTATACVAASLAELSRIEYPLGIQPIWGRYPVQACDFMERHGVAGRGFHPFYYGGYVLWRFWPREDRLPFMDIHQSGVRRDRDLMARASQPDAWRTLDSLHRFDYVMVRRAAPVTASLPDLLDADSTWALVFVDDAAALYVRRAGRFRPLANRFAYQLEPAGTARLSLLQAGMEADPAFRRRVADELMRETRESPWHAVALSRLARLALFEGRLGDARAHTEAALRIWPLLAGENQRLGTIALAEGRPRDALAALRREQRVAGGSAGLDVQLGHAWRGLGANGRARGAYQRALRREPGNAEARAGLAALGAGP